MQIEECGGRATGECTVNRKQLLVVALVVGLLAIGWMLGQPRYEIHRRLTVSWEDDPSDGAAPPPSIPASFGEDATVACPGPLAAPDERLDVREPGFAAAGWEGWRPVYEPNPCVEDRAARRRKLELGAVAILVLGLVGLVTFRPRVDTRPSTPSERAAA